MPVPSGVRAIVTDIEGTTTPIAFVYQVLFPFAAARLGEWCARTDRPDVAAALALLREEHAREAWPAGEARPDSGEPYARWLMARDRKSTGLKALQGLIWEEGYRSGELVGQVYPDVPAALTAWREAGIRLAVFSSGSVLAQRLLFGHSDQGDLVPRFEAYFDTGTGPKREAASYRAIASSLGVPPPAALYLSDVVPELEAALAAGMRTGLVVRPGNPPADPCGHPVHSSFAQLC